jgi:hypothetical protein
MSEVEDRTFVGQTIRMDDRRFVGCTFDGCRLTYAGGDAELENCTFTDCTWDVRDAAANTVRLLEQVRRSGAHVPADPDVLGDEGAWQERRDEPSSSEMPEEGSTTGRGARPSPIAHRVADYAEWAVVAVAAAALLLTLFLRA